MEPTAAVLSGFAIANMVLLGILMFCFARIYAKTKAQLPIGMIVFAGMLFLHNIISAFAYFSMEQIFSHEVFPYMLGITIAELGAIVVLLKITLD